jgi:large subunit ribosomal protein L9
MKVILQADIKGVGKKEQVIDVSDGYARNYLFPKKLAVEASKGNMTALTDKKSSEAAKAKRELEQAQELKAKMEGQDVDVPAKIGANGKLFGSITNKEIAQALSEKLGLAVDRKKINLTDPIKNVGEYKLEIKLHANVSAKVNVNIVGTE